MRGLTAAASGVDVKFQINTDTADAAQLVHLSVEHALSKSPQAFVSQYETEAGVTGVTVSLQSSVANGVGTDGDDGTPLSTTTIIIIAAAGLVVLVLVGLAVKHFCGSPAEAPAPKKHVFQPMETELVDQGNASPAGVTETMNPVATLQQQKP